MALVWKLRRATTHLHALHRLIQRYTSGNANEVINDFESEPGYLIVRAHSRRPLPPSAHQLIGDLLYNQRAALDYTACELARFNDEPIDEHVEFPIFTDRDDFRNPVSGNYTRAIKNRIGKLHAVHRAIIEDEQPFQGKYGAPEDDPLAILYRLSNYDRHQFIHVTSAVTNASSQNFTPANLASRFELVSVQYGVFKDNTEVARYRILPGPSVDVYVESNIRFDVAFSEEGPGAGRQVIKTLADISVRVGEVVMRLNVRPT